ncbi:hypothetical protein [Rathayibacter sp. AY1H2]|uniref:hypothetical protein n=1 Tax=Rathayibacter sp. AY1H2 TaxID=2080566 RepID=UPI0011B02A9C|nr:hypothetical protein [Rathayibacter sp. AY1H2]
MTTNTLAGTRVHFYRSFSYPDPASTQGRPILIERGGELIFTKAILDELRDRNGRLPEWIENLKEPDVNAEVEPIAALGPWPEDKSIFLRGELSWATERQKRLNEANALPDRVARQKAITAINKELGLAVPQNHNLFSF